MAGTQHHAANRRAILVSGEPGNGQEAGSQIVEGGVLAQWQCSGVASRRLRVRVSQTPQGMQEAIAGYKGMIPKRAGER